ncbi:hypothetical protein ONZ51_g2221 [Trametes cubensis]|uniref:Pre-rRNA-processing protein n=1 Tax=Trametes cubensis TaxID=1111947 RepID=A0AAD7XGX4_9APHY|nr:hypothetical protein ONZ51_g2221 [Trametes cubensis]
MPKSSKKKKDKAADFSKAKLKLGKGKQTPSNVVDTSFKARSIALPTQSIATDKDSDAPTTKRRLTFDALIAHLKHYNASTRRDAILGLRELLEAHPELINPHLTALVKNCVRIIGDEDASVRKALLAFFAWLFRQVPRDDIIPHSPVLLLFTTSAQTHIFPEIRIDAVRFLDIFLEYIPDVVTEGWTLSGSGSHGRRVLEGYLGILNAGTTFGEGGDTGPVQATSTASVVLSAASKLVVLRSLATFLNYAVSITGRNNDSAVDAPLAALITPTWYFSSSFASTSALHAFDALLQPIRSQSTSGTRADDVRTWHPEHSVETEEDFVGKFDLAQPSSTAWMAQDLDSVHAAVIALSADGQSSVDGLDPQVTAAAHIARTLHPTLVSTFLDCAPTVFSPSSSPPETELQMVLVVCRICRSLYGRILQDTAESGRTHGTAEADLQTMLSYLSPYFPFVINGQSAARRDIKIEQAFQDLNLIFCELSSFLVLASQIDNKRPPMQRSKTRSTRAGRSLSSMEDSPAISARQIERVSQYIMQLLRGEVPTAGVQSIPRPITPQAYTSLLPTIWSLINGRHSDAGESSEQLFSAVVEHAMKASSTSAVKRHTIDFLGRLTLLDLEPEYLGLFRCGQNQDKDAKLREWIMQLPKTMWELGGNHLSTTETIVRLLLRLSQRRSRLLDPATRSSLKSRLVPYFSIVHPARGKVRGPYAKLSVGSPLRRLVLDLVATIQGHASSKADAGDDGLVAAVFEAVSETPEESYMAGVIGRPRGI